MKTNRTPDEHQHMLLLLLGICDYFKADYDCYQALIQQRFMEGFIDQGDMEGYLSALNTLVSFASWPRETYTELRAIGNAFDEQISRNEDHRYPWEAYLYLYLESCPEMISQWGLYFNIEHLVTRMHQRLADALSGQGDASKFVPPVKGSDVLQ